MNFSVTIFILVIFCISHSAETIAVEKSRKYDVVIVGGGLSGLYLAYRLPSNLRVLVLEASSRLGGRIKSDSKGDSVIEDGAEFIDSQNRRLLSLLGELNIPSYDLAVDGHSPKYIVGQQIYSLNEISARIMEGDIFALNRVNSYRAQVDQNISIEEVLDRVGLSDFAKQFIRLIIYTETGLNLDMLPIKELFQYFSFNTSDKKIDILPGVDEGIKIVGGTERLIKELSQNLGKNVTVRLNSPVKSISAKPSLGGFRVRYIEGTQNVSSITKKVVLALPAHKLQEISFSQLAPADYRSLNGIGSVGYAKTSKMYIHFSALRWKRLGLKGAEGWSTQGFQWIDSSAPQGNGDKVKSLLVYSGKVPKSKVSQIRYYKKVLQELEKVYPGISRLALSYSIYTYDKSYSGNYQLGTTQGQIVRSLVNSRLYFVGEWVGVGHFGYMEGALKSVDKIIESLNGTGCLGFLID